jgi:hypothetical protein
VTIFALLPSAPLALARQLRRWPPAPLPLVRLLGHVEVELAFREIVRRLLPDESEALFAKSGTGANREADRAWAFCAAFESRYFPIYECEELEPLVYSIPFQRFGWSYDAFHDLDQRPGTLLLRAICAEPYAGTMGARVPLLEAVAELGIPQPLLRRIPADGVNPEDLHARLDATRFAAVAEFADWTWGQTDLAFLDFDDEVEVADADWSDETIQELTRQWQASEAIMNRVAALQAWLEKAPGRNFAELLSAVLPDSVRHNGRKSHAQTHGPDADGGRALSTDIALQTSGAA